MTESRRAYKNYLYDLFLREPLVHSSATPPLGLPDTLLVDARANRPELVLECVVECLRPQP